LGAGSIPTKGRGFDSHRDQANFSPCLGVNAHSE
jgi:hypothetical protein